METERGRGINRGGESGADAKRWREEWGEGGVRDGGR